MIYTDKGSSAVKEAKIDVFLEFSRFFYDPVDVGNLISGSSAFSKSRLYIWRFLVHVLLKRSLDDFEHDLASTCNEYNCAVVWTFFGTGMKTDLFQSCGHCWVFQICWHIMLGHFSCVWLCATPWTLALQAPPSVGLSSQEHQSGLPFPSVAL